MNMTHDCPSPGDSATDLSGIEHPNPDVTSDEASDVDWSLPVWDESDPPEIAAPTFDRPLSTRAAHAEEPTSRQRLGMIVLASYASAVTIALLYVLFTVVFGQSHELENLPDVRPLEDSEFRYVPPQATLPPGHQLQIGDARQFGHILVEPLRVTSGQVEFVHFSGHADRPAPESVPALKLWVRFTNLSDDQLIAPLDRTLVFKRDYLEDADQLLANNFIAHRTVQSPQDSRLLLLDQPLSSEWNLAHQQLGVRLKPGESLETFLPSESVNLGDLHGELVWRMHIRKGYHDLTGHGVTTLVDVAFHEDNIQAEANVSASSGEIASPRHVRQARS